jgi:hypothetical protein
MVTSTAATPDEYVASLPADRATAVQAVRDVINANPSLYLNNVYGDRSTEAWFRERWARTGKKLDMGKSCVRIRRLEDVPLDVIGETIARTELDEFIRHYESARGSSRAARKRP